MNKKEIIIIGIGSITYTLLSIGLGLYLDDGLIIFLGWNMTLSLIAYGIGLYFVYVSKTHKYFPTIIIGILWILFFPNTIYMLTDFIHFQNYSFFESYMSVYDLNIASWLVFTHVLVGALFSTFIGIKSLDNVLKIVTQKYNFNQTLSLLVIFFTSSFAIYIGRFLRLNSWDIFRPINLIETVIANINMFSIVFILLFTGIHFFIYFMFHQFKYE